MNIKLKDVTIKDPDLILKLSGTTMLEICLAESCMLLNYDMHT